MTPADPLDALLQRLTEGDVEAAERVFRLFEPVLRVMVRRRLTPRLRAKFDSMDVVQSAWADVLDGYREVGWRFHDREHLKAYLARVTHNHFVNHCRRNGRAIALEQPYPGEPDAAHALPPAPQPRPSEEAQAGELWEAMMDLCPPAHHELLRLKRQGYALAEIAERTGLHEGSVRRILYELARRVSRSGLAPQRPGSTG
jgi:RNA polymerase sigma-70 factor (ECF subfamily)